MNRKHGHLFFLPTILSNRIRQRFSHFGHPIQDSATNRSFPLLSIIILGIIPFCDCQKSLRLLCDFRKRLIAEMTQVSETDPSD
jgi:hypothetical protein